MGVGLAAVLGVVAMLAWVTLLFARRGHRVSVTAYGSQVRDALTQFADQSLELQSVTDILAFAAEAATVGFGCRRVVAFEPGAGAGDWEVSVPGRQALAPVPPAMRGLFGWFKHNSAIVARADLSEARLGAMRGPLSQLMTAYEVDVMLPLVDRGEILAALGLALDRAPSAEDRDLLRQLRLEVTAACANVRLHREAAHMVTLAQEVDLAGAVQRALVPPRPDGDVGWLSWAADVRQSGDAGSDFWSVYRVSADRMLFLIGDATGAGLAGSMVSAVIKSCADTLIEALGEQVDPATLLAALSRALWRPTKPANMSCFAALFDRAAPAVHYSNAGHRLPYHVSAAGSPLGVLTGTGPVLGDEPDSRYTVHRRDLDRGDVVVLFTDGLIEPTGPAGKPFGERGVQRALRGPATTAATTLDTIVAAADAHAGTHPPTDDIVILAVKLAQLS